MSEPWPLREFPLQFHRWRVKFVVGPGSNIELFVDDCLRKQRRGAADDTLYVWTNLELEWEEHRWLEARLVPAAGDHGGAQLHVTVNGEPWLRAELPKSGEPQVTQFEVS